MYNLEQLRMFVETANLGSFSACARKLGKVQSAVSQGIANLEIDFDRQLFDRSTRKPSLTPDGTRLLSYAQAILLQMDELDSAAQAMGRQEEALIRLAVDNALLLPNFYAVLARFERQFSATDIEVVSTTSFDVLEAIESDQADIGLTFVEFDFNRDVELGYIGSLNFYPVCHPQHSLAQVNEITAGDLLPHRQVMSRSSKGSVPTQLPQLSSKAWFCNNYTAMQSLTEQGIGWAYLPAYLAEESIQAGNLKKMKFSFDHKTWKLSIEMVRQKNKAMGPALAWLHDELKSLLDE
ncbi:MAG: LysR family transcriptional regulator [Oleispira sp.]|nr:LysR family transcriptional regulator [Oleispira sp.]MBL4881783.1 LysR family transcriptional regulator [Oleispira sp.]